jgi:hypothetical protein
MMRKILLTWMVSLALLAIVVPAFAQENACLDLGGTYNSTTGVCSFANGLTIDIEYPTEFASEPWAQAVIDNWLDEQRTAIVEAAEIGSASSPGPYFLGIEYDIFQYEPDVKSILFTISDYTGGAHPNLYYQTFTFNLETNTVLDLEDLLLPGGLNTISTIVIADLTTQMGSGADVAWINGGAGPTWENYASFVLDADSFTFYFPPYQVAPYAAGPFNVDVPLSTIRSAFRPPYMKG